jgi:dihydroneopterin triphosphate diphosphatase
MAKERLKVQVWIHRRSASGIELLLLLLRPERGGFWQPVTGGVEEGEELGAAALREAREESGMEFRGPALPLGTDFRFEARGRRFHEFGFRVEADAAARVSLDGREHVDHRWVGPAEAKKLLHHASNVEMLEVLIKMLGN